MGAFDRSSSSERPRPTPSDGSEPTNRLELIANIGMVVDRVASARPISTKLGEDISATIQSVESGFRVSVATPLPDSRSLRDVRREYTVRADGRAELRVKGLIPTPYAGDLARARVSPRALGSFDFRFEVIGMPDVSTGLYAAVNELVESVRDQRSLADARPALRRGPDDSTAPGLQMAVNGKPLDQWRRDMGDFPVSDDPVFGLHYNWSRTLPSYVFDAVRRSRILELPDVLDSEWREVEGRKR